jgi:hypothetical protein
MCRHQGNTQHKQQKQKTCKLSYVNTTSPNQQITSKRAYPARNQVGTCSIKLQKGTNFFILSCAQEREGSNRVLFKEGQQTQSANSMRKSSSRTPPTHNDITKEEANNNKRQHDVELAEPPSVE